MSYSKLLIDDYPILVLPKLAEQIGLNEAIFLQQLHYWTNGKSAKNIDGHNWIYNTYEDWAKQFPFWSVSTIKRTINSLEKQNMIIKGNYNKKNFDKTVWYSINHEEVNRMSQRLGQNEPTRGSKWTNGLGQNEPTNTIDYPKTTSETTKDIVEQASTIPIKEIVSYLNDKTGGAYRPTTPSTKKLIQARIREGFTEDDFYKVIDTKTSEWLKDSQMKKYLRPQTLFGTKFESYLNQPEQSKAQTQIDRDIEITSWGWNF